MKDKLVSALMERGCDDEVANAFADTIMERGWLTSKDLMQLFGIAHPTANLWLRTKYKRARKLVGRWVVPVEEVVIDLS
jgi:hypothetical protein